MTTLASINSLEATQSRLEKGRIPRFGPILMLCARPSLLLLAQGITFLLFRQLNVQNAEVAIRNWWTVFGTLADLGCLGLLIWLTRREGIGLRDLIGFARSKLKFDIPLGLGIFIIVFPLTVFGGYVSHVHSPHDCPGAYLPARSPSAPAHYWTLADGPVFGPFYATDWLRSFKWKKQFIVLSQRPMGSILWFCTSDSRFFLAPFSGCYVIVSGWFYRLNICSRERFRHTWQNITPIATLVRGRPFPQRVS